MTESTNVEIDDAQHELIFQEERKDVLRRRFFSLKFLIRL